MKVRIRLPDGSLQTCMCGGQVFRYSKCRRKWTGENSGYVRDIEVCDNCGSAREFNKMDFKVVKAASFCEPMNGNHIPGSRP